MPKPRGFGLRLRRSTTTLDGDEFGLGRCTGRAYGDTRQERTVRAMSMKATRGHRPHVKEGRRTTSEVYLSTEERATIEVAAARAGLRRGSYIAASAVRAARSDLAGQGIAVGATDESVSIAQTPITARETIEELRALRRLLGNIAGNVNDLARHANSTGELKAETSSTLAYVRTFNDRLDDELMAVLRRLR